MVTAGIAAFYGIQAIARSAAIIAVFVVATILLAALALLPRMELINFPPLLYDGGSPVLAGALEELPRSMELAVLGLLIPYVKGSLIKGSLWWIGIFTAVALVIQATVVGVLGDLDGYKRQGIRRLVQRLAHRLPGNRPVFPRFVVPDIHVMAGPVQRHPVGPEPGLSLIHI